MAYTYKTNLEDVADALQKLKWSEMDELASYFKLLDIPTDPGSHFWSQVFHDWSSDKMAEYENRTKKGDQ